MPQVPAGLRKERAARLRGAGDAALARFLESRVGATERVLVEKPDFGRSEQFAPVTLGPATPGEIVAAHVSGEIVAAHVSGEIVAVRVSGVADGRLLARAAA